MQTITKVDKRKEYYLTTLRNVGVLMKLLSSFVENNTSNDLFGHYDWLR